MRWNFLHLGRQENPVNIFLQGGLGLISVYRAPDGRIIGFRSEDVVETRGSFMVDVALGATIPLTQRWHIEPSVRGGYPHLWGVSVTAGYKFPLPRVTQYQITTTRIEAAQAPARESARRIVIPAIEYILFGPDIGSYNVGIDADARQLNELVLNATARMLNESPDLFVRIEGHANPYTINRSEHDELMALSAMRSNVVADQLRARGVSDDQMNIISFGGTRTATNEWDVRNRNRRVEMMLIQFEDE